jgi:hypothetical protein
VTGSRGVIALREAMLNVVVGRTGNAILNPGPAGASSGRFHDLAANLERAMNAVKAEAIHESGRYVDYARLAASPAFAAYRDLTPALRELNLAHIATRSERLAFWLNLYNALVIDGIIAYGVEHGATEGVLGVFAFFRRAAYDVGGLRFSCDDIEHGILRGNRGRPYLPGQQFGASDPRRGSIIDPPDARVHFALRCGRRSSPPIVVYDADQIDAQLTLATRSFLDQEIVLKEQRGELLLPRVFRWFARDFGGRPGVVAFLLYYLPEDDRRAWLEARGPRARIGYHRHDSSLNARL